LPPKKDVAEALLRGPSLYIHLDPRKPDVIVPPYFKKQPQLVLQVGLNMAIPIPDLKVDDEGVSCTLSFNRKQFWCRLPWTAVFALVGEDMKGMVWPDEVPAEVAAQRDSKVPASTEPKSPRVRAAAREGGTRRRTPPDTTPPKKLAVVPGPVAVSSGPSVSSPASTSSGGPAQSSLPFASSPPSGQPRAPSTPSSGAQAAREGDKPTQPSAPREAAKPGKRELPPYLRVVK
jgi:stringent starvation protein B